jgi:hypothetical protein
VKEDLVNQIAAALTAKLLSPLNAQSWGANPAALLLVADSMDLAAAQAIMAQQTSNFSVICLAELNTRPAQAADFSQQCATAPLIIISHPSLELVSQLAYAPTDNSKTAALLAVLNQQKRLVMLLNGVFAPSAFPLALAPAIAQLQQKLQTLGVEFCSVEQLPVVLSASLPSTPSTHKPVLPLNTASNTITGNCKAGHCSCGCASKTLPTPTNITSPSRLANQPLPIASHPSQYKLGNAVAALVDFVAAKPCTMEQGKRCDNCDICNTLGF